jgi:hypothetical protein
LRGRLGEVLPRELRAANGFAAERLALGLQRANIATP